VSALVQAGEEGVAFVGVEPARDGFSLGSVIAFGPDADPVAVFARKLDDIGVGIFALELLLELAGFAFLVKGTDLYAPAATGVDGLGGFIDVDADAGETGAVNACGPGGGYCEVDNAAVNEGAPVRDAHSRGLAGFQVGDHDERAHRKCAVGSGQRVVVKDLTVGCAAALVRRGVPRGVAGFGENGLVGVDEFDVFLADARGGDRRDGNARGLAGLLVFLIELGEFLGRRGGHTGGAGLVSATGESERGKGQDGGRDVGDRAARGYAEWGGRDQG
jgi:hypothetical protein